MTTHSDKGRYLIALAVLQSSMSWSAQFRQLCIHCILAYEPQRQWRSTTYASY